MWALKISNFLLKLSCGARSPDFFNLNVIGRPPVALCPNSERYIYINILCRGDIHEYMNELN